MQPFDASKPMIEQFPSLETFVSDMQRLATDLSSKPYLMFEFYFFIVRISVTNIKTVNLKPDLVYQSAYSICQTIKECSEKYYPLNQGITIWESTYINSKEVKFQINDADPNAPDSLNKEQVEIALTDMLKEYGLQLNEA